MPSAVVGLLPLAAALIVTVKGFKRIHERRGRAPSLPPQPREMPAAPPKGSRPASPAPDAACRLCASPIPAGETICPLCARKVAPSPPQGWRTLLHWLLFLAMMTAIIGTGALLAP